MPTSRAYEIYPFNIQKLKDRIVEIGFSSLHILDSKLHFIYLEDYFKTLGAKTILVENDYVDRDFLEDYSGYYVRCFNEYSRKCTRFHFFDRKIDEEDFGALLKGNAERLSLKDLQDHYLGFIVVKPLPQTVIGRTCLKTYPPDGDRRHFPILRPYEPNLFGIPLRIKSLAFQEQDSVAAACATSALWSIFQRTGMLFQHCIPSPVEITKTASFLSPQDTRSLPNKGLTVTQMANAIRNVGLEPLLINPYDEFFLRSALYGYLRDQIPLLLVINLFDTSKGEETVIGSHAVTVTGYSLGAKNAALDAKVQFRLKSSRIDKIYVHDDQVGPFARMEFDNQKVNLQENGKVTESFSISTSWKGQNGQIGSIRAIPLQILAPLYHKIRIPIDLILASIVYLDGIIEEGRIKKILALPDRLEWDLYLTTIENLKKDIFSSLYFKDRKYQSQILLENMPRFIWRGIGTNEDNPILELLFDATDIEQGSFFLRAIEYNSGLSTFLRSADIYRRPELRIFNWFEKNPSPYA